MKKSNQSARNKLARRRGRASLLGLEALDKRLVLSAAPPMAMNDAFISPQDAPLAITSPGLLANDTDAENDPLTASLFSGPAHGALTMQGDGSFNYTPDSGFVGVDSFMYSANDGTSNSNLAAVTLQIGDSVQAPAIDLAGSGAAGGNFAASFTEDAGPVLLAASGATLSDASSATLNSLSVAIANLPDGPMESLSADTAGTDINASYNAGTGVLTLAGVDTVSHYEQVLKTVAYNNTSQNPQTEDREISFVANDGAKNSNLATTTLSMSAVNDPASATDDSYAVNENNALNVPATGVLANDMDPDSSALTAVLDAGPAHGSVTLNPDGSFAYTPAANFSGTDSFTYQADDGHGFTYQADDGHGDSNVGTVSINVLPVNQAPAAANDSYSTNENAPLAVSTGGVLANDSDVENDPLTAALVNGPQHGTVALNADGTFTYTPAANFSGTDGFTYQANDGRANSSVAAVTITVNPVNQPPLAANDSYSTDENSPLAVSTGGVLANDSDVESDPLTASMVAGPQHGTVTLNSDGSFTYTPAADFSGTDSFTYQANDGQSSSSVAAVTITVNPVVHPPVAANDSYSTNENSPLDVSTGGVLANDTDPADAPLTASLVAGPQHGTVTLHSDGTFEYAPADNFTGTDSFTYQANDGSANSNVAAVTITVNPVHQPPVAVNDSYTVEENSPMAVSTGGVLANDIDPSNAPLTAMLVGSPEHGTVSLNPDGTFTYTPAANFSGTDSFSYKANDGQADSNVAAVTITVNAVHPSPAALNDRYSVAEDTTLTTGSDSGVLRNDSDAEGEPLTAALVDAPQHGSVTLNADGTFSYTPTANFHGTDSFSYKANDGHADSTLATVAVTVDPVNDAPAAAADGYSTDANSPLTVNAASGVLANDTDVDGDPLSASLVSGPQHGSVTLNSDGSFNYTPAADFQGADSFSYQAADGEADSNVATATITVNPPAPAVSQQSSGGQVHACESISTLDVSIAADVGSVSVQESASSALVQMGMTTVSTADVSGGSTGSVQSSRLQLDVNLAQQGGLASSASVSAQATSPAAAQVDLSVSLHETAQLPVSSAAVPAANAADLAALELALATSHPTDAEAVDAIFGSDM